jgi:O-antigen/teichoic acid export membrane protein
MVEPPVGAIAAAEARDILDTDQAGPAAVRGGALRVVGYFVGALAGAGSAALLFRHLGVVDTGRYVAIASLVAIVGGVTDLGLTAMGVREVSAKPPGEGEQILRTMLGVRVTLTIAGIAVMTAIAAVGYPAVFVVGVPLAGLALLLQTTQDNYAIVLMTSLRLRWLAVLELVRNVGAALLIVLFVLLDAKLLVFVSVGIPVALVALLINAQLVRGERSLVPSFDWVLWRRMLTLALPYSAATAAAALYFRMAIVLTSQLTSGRQLGYFSAAFRVIEVLSLVPLLLTGSAVPILARSAVSDHRRLGYALERLFEVTLIVGAWVALAIAAGASLAVAIIGGSKFSPAVPVLAIEGIALGATFVSSVWANGLLSLAQYRQILVVNLVMLTFSAAVIAVLVGIDGARGAAIGTAIAEVTAALLNGAVLIRGRPALRPRLRVVPRVALAAAIGSIALIIPGVPSILRVVLTTALYGAVLLATRAFPPELLDLLPPGVRARWQRTS